MAKRMPQKTMRRPFFMVSSASLRPLAQEAMTKVRMSLAHMYVKAKAMTPEEPMVRVPKPAATKSEAIIGAKIKAKPPSATTRVMPKKRTKAKKR